MSQVNVVSEIANKGFCIGCGVCAAICPSNNLRVTFNSLGEYQVCDSDKCLSKCSLCLEVCPRAEKSEDVDTLAQSEFGHIRGIRHRPEVGFYLSSYEGFAIGELREKAASGGLATWLLVNLMECGEIDGVVCVRPNVDPGKLFDYFIARTVEEIRSASSSAYYPVELSGCIKEIISKKGRYAVVGVPCFLTALTLAQRQIPKLNDRIKYKVGLVCSRLPGKNYADYFVRYFGLQTDDVMSLKFRDKSFYPARMRGISITEKKGVIHRANHRIDFIWGSGLVTPTACMFCDDIFAEMADVTFMDAWLPEYQHEHLGRSLVLVRSTQIYDVFESALRDEKVVLQTENIERVIKTQKLRLFNKRDQLKYRQELAKKWDIFYPSTRDFSISRLSQKEKYKAAVIFYRQQRTRGKKFRAKDRMFFSMLVCGDNLYIYVRKIYGKLRFLLGK